jgi:hypothetical protein
VEAEERARDDPGERPPSATDEGTAEPAETGEPIAHERCAHHPGRPAVARCSVCDGPVCLSCAVPVRGRVLGPECLAAELGDPGLVAPPDPGGAGPGVWGTVAGAVVAVAGTIAPWTRTGAGDRPLGAWVPTVRWSTVAALAAVALLVAAIRLRRSGGRPAGIAAGAFATIVLIAGALAIAFPPTFQSASWGAWVTSAGGALAVAALALDLVAERHPTQGV